MNQVSNNLEKTRGLRRWWIRGVLLVAGCVVFVVFFLSSILVGLEGGFFSRQVYSFPAPDGRTALTVSKRVQFPANEIFDPAISVTVRLCDVASGRVLDSIKLEMEEDSDLLEPRIVWGAGAVTISEIDERNPRRFTLHSPIT